MEGGDRNDRQLTVERKPKLPLDGKIREAPT